MSSTARTATPPPNTAVSVTSTISWSGVIPVSASTSATTRAKPGSASCRAETFTLIRTGAAAPCSLCQPTKRAHAVRRIHSPSSTIRPLRSATGMKSTGLTNPRTGCCQRTSDSTYRVRPSGRLTMGW